LLENSLFPTIALIDAPRPSGAKPCGINVVYALLESTFNGLQFRSVADNQWRREGEHAPRAALCRGQHLKGNSEIRLLVN